MPGDYIFGIHAVLGALKQSATHIDAVWVDEERADRRMADILNEAAQAHIKVHQVPRPKLDQLAQGQRHQGVIASYRPTPVRGDADLQAFLATLAPPGFFLILDGVQDPHNLGACLRCADAAGVNGVIIPRDQSAPLTPTVRRVACGAAESVPVFQVTNLSRTLKRLREAGIWLVGAAGDAPQTLYESDLRGPLALVLGGEESGLRRLTREHCDFLVSIPMRGQVSSLNVSVATGICLFEAVRQRQR